MTKRGRIVASLIGAVALLLVAGAIWGRPHFEMLLHHYRALPLNVETSQIEITVREPSGIIYIEETDSFLVVSDEGQLVELDRGFRTMGIHPIPGDIEGITLHPETGTVFLAVESIGAIMEYELQARKILRTLFVDFSSHSDFRDGRRRNSGIEGVTLTRNEDGTYTLFAIVEAEPARIIALSADVSADATRRARLHEPSVDGLAPVTIDKSFDIGMPRLSDIAYDPETDRLLVTGSSTRTLTVTTRDGQPIKTVRLPGPKPEGFCLLPNGDALVAQDSGGITVCRKLRAELFAEKKENRP